MPLLVTKGLGPPGGAGTAFIALTASATALTVTVTFPDDRNIVLVGRALDPEEYTFESDTGATVRCLAVVADENTIVLTVSDMTDGEPYTLFMPDAGIIDSEGNGCVGPFELGFQGAADAPIMLMIRVIDARMIEVVYSKSMAEDAADIDNYAADNGLEVTSVSRVNSSTYRVVTSYQTRAASYNLTVTGVHDAAGNLIA